MSKESCFLCGKIKTPEIPTFKIVNDCTVPASEKTIQLVLQHLANCIKIKLIFQPETSICSDCYKELADYDQLMVNLLTNQKKLTQKLERIISFEIDEKEDILAVVTDDEEECVADINSESDVKEKCMEVDEVSLQSQDQESEEISSNHSDDLASSRRQIACVACSKVFPTKTRLKMHVSEMHNISKPYTCNICGVTRKDEEYLELHMNIHEGKTENECRYCPKKFSRPVNTLRHMRFHWDRKKYQCEKCGERFSLDNMLYNHRLRHEAEENPLICSHCNQNFKSRKTFNHHMLIHQENRPRHPCEICSKSFTERYTLKMHMKTHGHIKKDENNHIQLEEKEDEESTAPITVMVEEDSKKLVCIICSGNFDTREVLDHHLQSAHDVIVK